MKHHRGLHCCLSSFIPTCVASLLSAFSSSSKDPCHCRKKMLRVFVTKAKMEKQGERLKEISFAWIRRRDWLGECLWKTLAWPWRRTRAGLCLLYGQWWQVKWGHHAHADTHIHTHCKCTQSHMSTRKRCWEALIVCAFDNIMLGQETLIYCLWRKVHFSAIFSLLEVELKWSPPTSPHTNPTSFLQPFLPPPTNSLSVPPSQFGWEGDMEGASGPRARFGGHLACDGVTVYSWTFFLLAQNQIVVCFEVTFW